MGFFDYIANKFTEKKGSKATDCNKCSYGCIGYPVEDPSAPLINKGIRLVGATIGGVLGVNCGGSIAEPIGKKIIDNRLRNGKWIVYKFRCEHCNNVFFRMMPEDESYYVPTKEQELERNIQNRELIMKAWETRYDID